MTTRSRASTALRTGLQFILGPWPLHLGSMWALYFALSFSSTLSRVTAVGAEAELFAAQPISERVVQILVFSFAVPTLVVVPLIIYRALRLRFIQRPVTRAEYFLTLVCASIIGAAFFSTIFQTNIIIERYTDNLSFFNWALRLFIPLWFLNALLGLLLGRIQKQSDLAQAALQTVVKQRRLLLESEERVRGQVAAYLHDRVQTDLVSIGLRVRAAVALEPKEMAREIESAMDELERVRSEEVRSASRQLSPNLTQVDLNTALRELAGAYRPGLIIKSVVSDPVAQSLRLPSELSRATGIYRICEQGLLNAAIHGHATECSIQVWFNSDNEFVVEIHDNGVGLPPKRVEPGMGFSVISAWVESLDGRWSLEPSEIGAKLTAVLPAV
jgi:signal transduction histidine kinase